MISEQPSTSSDAVVEWTSNINGIVTNFNVIWTYLQKKPEAKNTEKKLLNVM